MFENTPEINKNPLVGLVPWEIAKKYRPKAGKALDHQILPGVETA